MHRKPTIHYSGAPKPLAPPVVRPAPTPQPSPQPSVRTFTLRQLEGQFEKVVPLTTDEVETDEGDCKGLFVWRDKKGNKYFWSPKPVRYAFDNVETLAEADLIMFLCPLCFAKNGGPKGTHSVMVSFTGRDIPEEAGSRDAEGKPSRWTASGTSLDDLVLTPSILLDAKRAPDQGCHWHGFVGSSGIPAGHAG